MSDLTRQIVAAAILSAVAIVAMVAAASTSRAADVPEGYFHHGAKIRACGQPQETVMLFDEKGRPTVAGRTEYYHCITNSTLLPGDIPPPPEYCCS